MSITWEEWSAPAHAAASQKVRLAQALEQARQQTPGRAERLGQWLAEWSGRASAAARLVLDATSQTVEQVSEGLDALAAPVNPWGFHLGAAPGASAARGRREGPSGEASLDPAVPQVYM